MVINLIADDKYIQVIRDEEHGIEINIHDARGTNMKRLAQLELSDIELGKLIGMFETMVNN